MISAAAVLKRAVARGGFTLKRFEFPNDHPIDLLALLADSRLGPDPLVVQIGAHDGVTADPASSTIRSRGFRALLVEPVPPIFEKLKENYAEYPQVTLENCAVAPQDGPVWLYRVVPDDSLPAYVSELASFDRRVILKQKRTIRQIEKFIERIRVSGVTLETLLRRHGIESIDWLQIDTEGFDFEIVRMLWRTPIRPTLISLETEHLSRQNKIECARLLRAGGYRYVTVGRDTIALQ